MNTTKIINHLNTKILVLMILISFCTNLSCQESHIYPNESWEYNMERTPCSYLNLLESFVIDSLNTTGLIIVKKGKIIFQYGDVEELSYIASARKSILSMMYGKYVEDGTIKLNETLDELGIDDVNVLTKDEKQATVDFVINARSGVYLPASNPGSAPNKPKRGAHKPGTHFYYNNWDFNVAGTIFEQKTNKNIYQAFEEGFAKPLELQDFNLEDQNKYKNDARSIHPAYHFDFSTRDMARIGYLMLRNGRWKEKQIVPENWVKKSTSKISDAEFGSLISGYSYMWWLHDSSKYTLLEGAFTAAGAFGQFITVIPKLEIVIAHKTKVQYQRRTGIDDYDKLIIKIIEGEKQNTSNHDFLALTAYTGEYYDSSQKGDNSKLNIDVGSDGKLYLKGSLFPNPIGLKLCNAATGLLDIPQMRNPYLLFSKNNTEKIVGFHIGSIYVEKVK